MAAHGRIFGGVHSMVLERHSALLLLPSNHLFHILVAKALPKVLVASKPNSCSKTVGSCPAMFFISAHEDKLSSNEVLDSLALIFPIFSIAVLFWNDYEKSLSRNNRLLGHG